MTGNLRDGRPLKLDAIDIIFLKSTLAERLGRFAFLLMGARFYFFPKIDEPGSDRDSLCTETQLTPLVIRNTP